MAHFRFKAFGKRTPAWIVRAQRLVHCYFVTILYNKEKEKANNKAN